MSDPEFEVLVSEHFLDIARRVAHIEPQICEPTVLDGTLKTFGLDVHGDYTLKLSLCAPDHVLKTLAEGMRRGEKTDLSGAVLYVAEFFNILCGRIISSLNRSTHTSARFGIPRVNPGMPEQKPGAQKLYYLLPSGPLLIQAVHQ